MKMLLRSCCDLGFKGWWNVEKLEYVYVNALSGSL